jgi:hypothetical protein
MKFFHYSIVFLLLLGACTTQTEETKETPIETKTEEKLSVDSLKIRVQMVHDSMQTAWQIMTISDDEKFSDIKRLLQEATYTSSYNPVKLTKLQTLTDSVLASRYTLENMTSEHIDQYDAATANLLKNVFQFVSETPELENHSITDELLTSIQKSDNDMVNHRVLYDRWAKEYNYLVYHYKEELQQLGEPFSSYKSKPIFQLQA